MKWYGNLNNRIDENRKPKAPEVGDGATEYMYSDRKAHTVTKVIKPTLIEVQQDKAIRIDNNGQSDCQQYRYERDPAAGTFQLRLNKWGQWKIVGDPKGSTFVIGVRDEYFDFGF